MGSLLDRIPFSGIIRIRDLMYSVRDPFRLDQGDVSFDAPDSVKDAMARAIVENRSHYAQTTGLPRLRDLLVEKLRTRNGIPVENPDEVFVTNGGIHAIYVACQALLEPGDEVIVPDPLWPPAVSSILAAQGVPVACPLHERLAWRFDMDELAACIGPRTRAIYLNSPQNPTGGVLTSDDLEQVAELASRHDLWVLSDEAYEDVLFDGAAHVSIAAVPGMYERTVPIYTFSKSWAMTGLRLGYLAIRDARIRERMRQVLFLTSSNVSTVVQHGGIGALEGPQDSIEAFRLELEARRDLFYAGIPQASAEHLAGTPPKGAFYAFLHMQGDWSPVTGGAAGQPAGERANQRSTSWEAVEALIQRARIGCVPGVDFGRNGEGYIRFCFARDRAELRGVLEALRRLFLEPPPTEDAGRRRRGPSLRS
jgi:aspartate aminotransferase